MIIIDKLKDYYDYVSSIYGVDNKIVFERHSRDIQGILFPCLIDTAYLVLQIGNSWHLLKCDVGTPFDRGGKMFQSIRTNSYIVANIKDIEIVVEREVKEEERVGDDVIYLMPISNQFSVFHAYTSYMMKHVKKHGAGNENIDYDEMFREMFSMETASEIKRMIPSMQLESGDKSKLYYNVKNPNLSHLHFGSVKSPEEVFIQIQNYISSRIKDGVDLNMSDEQKIVQHGFDKKSSFRPNIKR